jgi:uncharacterized protein YciI
MWYIALRNSIQPSDQWTATLDEHLTWMKRQHEAGKILLSGPGKTDAGQVGIYLIRADSRDEAERIAGSDPFTAAGSCNFELIEWNVHQIMGVGPFSQAELGAPASNRH